MNFQNALFLLPGLIIGLTVHEASHAISAKWLGDRTAEKMGRISLNPMRHLSIYGTLALFFLHFGWGKPVIVNLYNFKKPKFYYLLSSLAGPASNLLICGVCLGVLYMHPPRIVFNALVPIFLINGMLAAINLVPVPPLDGSKIWPCLIPGMKPTISGKWSMIWVVVLIIALQTGGIGKVLGPIQNGMWWLLPEQEMDNGSSETRPEVFPEELVPPENATDIVYVDRTPSKKGILFGCDGMSFSVDNKYGNMAYVHFEQRLTEYGWRKLKYMLLEPETENNGEFTELHRGEEGAKSEVHTDSWVKSLIGVIQISRLKTTHDKDKSKNTTAFNILYVDDLADLMKNFISEYKKLHPEELEGIEIAENVAKREE